MCRSESLYISNTGKCRYLGIIAVKASRRGVSEECLLVSIKGSSMDGAVTELGITKVRTSFLLDRSMLLPFY
jgi:hypothetical protein